MPPYQVYGQPFGSIEHYYGDVIRQFFVGIAILIGVCIPFSDNIRLGVAIGVPVVVVLVLLAGLTNPHGNFIMVCDAAASVVGFFLAEMMAIGAYNAGSLVALAILEFIAILFLATSYFSIKTVRAMALHKIGKKNAAGEFYEQGSR
jgi:hypothetical protein